MYFFWFVFLYLGCGVWKFMYGCLGFGIGVIYGFWWLWLCSICIVDDYSWDSKCWVCSLMVCKCSCFVVELVWVELLDWEVVIYIVLYCSGGFVVVIGYVDDCGFD